MRNRSKVFAALAGSILIAALGLTALSSASSNPASGDAGVTGAAAVKQQLKKAKRAANAACKKSKKLSKSNKATNGEKAKAKRQCVKARQKVKRLKNRLPISIKGSGSPFGKMLFDRNSQAIYIFQKERSKTAKCYGACASAWPPVLTSGKPTALKGVKQRQLGTTKRKGGATQATYAGHPLYYYAHEGPGDVLCHNVVSFGGNWKVIHGSGRPAD